MSFFEKILLTLSLGVSMITVYFSYKNYSFTEKQLPIMLEKDFNDNWFKETIDRKFKYYDVLIKDYKDIVSLIAFTNVEPSEITNEMLVQKEKDLNALFEKVDNTFTDHIKSDITEDAQNEYQRLNEEFKVQANYRFASNVGWIKKVVINKNPPPNLQRRFNIVISYPSKLISYQNIQEYLYTNFIKEYEIKQNELKMTIEQN